MIGAIIALLSLLGIIALVHFNYDALAILRASGSQGVSTETNTGVEVGPTGLCKAILHVTTVGSSATLNAKIQGSTALAGTYYDIPGGQWLDPTDGAIIDAAGKYEIFIKTDFSFLRTVATVATAAVTWEAFLATAE